MLIYAHTDARLWSSFCSDILDALPIVDSCVIGADLHNVEAIEDVRAQTLPRLASISTIELDAWDRLLFLVGCHHAWRELSFSRLLGSLDFS